MSLRPRVLMPARFCRALERLLRPDRHEMLRVLEGQPLTVADILSVPTADWAARSSQGR